MSLSDHIRELRAAYGETQAQFAKRIGVSTRSMARYEAGVHPKGYALATMYKLARDSSRFDLADALLPALVESGGHPPSARDEGESIWANGLIDIMRNRSGTWTASESLRMIQQEITSALRKIVENAHQHAWISPKHVDKLKGDLQLCEEQLARSAAGDEVSKILSDLWRANSVVSDALESAWFAIEDETHRELDEVVPLIRQLADEGRKRETRDLERVTQALDQIEALDPPPRAWPDERATIEAAFGISKAKKVDK